MDNFQHPPLCGPRYEGYLKWQRSIEAYHSGKNRFDGSLKRSEKEEAFSTPHVHQQRLDKENYPNPEPGLRSFWLGGFSPPEA